MVGLSTKNILSTKKKRKKIKRVRRTTFFIYGYRSGNWFSVDFFLSHRLPTVKEYLDDYEYLVVADSHGNILKKVIGFYQPIAIKKPVKKEEKVKCLFDIEPSKQINQYMVTPSENCTENDIAELIFEQAKMGATVWRFWYNRPTSPEYPKGVGSTHFVYLLDNNIDSVKRIKQYMRLNMPDKIIQWFYLVGKPYIDKVYGR